MSEPVATPVSTEALSQALISSPVVISEHSEMIMDDSTMNHLSYKATNKVPYVIDYFGIREFYETNPVVTEMAKELHLLLVKQDTETTVAETKMILDALAQELNLQKNDAPFYKLKKTLFMAKLKDQMAQNNQAKMKMLADIEKM